MLMNCKELKIIKSSIASSSPDRVVSDTPASSSLREARVSERTSKRAGGWCFVCMYTYIYSRSSNWACKLDSAHCAPNAFTRIEMVRANEQREELGDQIEELY